MRNLVPNSLLVVLCGISLVACGGGGGSDSNSGGVGSSSSSSSSRSSPDVTITVNPSSTHAISKWIYGINSYGGIANVPHATMDRAGGNRWTAYNWENNYSNAGSDYGPYHNDTFLSGSATPAEA